MKWSLLLLGILLSTSLVGQPVTVKSISIADRQTNVSKDETIKIVFSEPLNIGYVAGHNQNGWFPINFLGTSMSGVPDNDYMVLKSLGETNDTIYVQLNLEVNKVYVFRLFDAESIYGNKLQFKEITFSTGVPIPSNTIFGTISGFSANVNKYVMAIPTNSFIPDVLDRGPLFSYRFSKINNDGSYQVGTLEDGSYYLIAVENKFNNSDRDKGDIAIYDQDNNGFPDEISISGNKDILGIDFSIKTFSKAGTSLSRDPAEQTAKSVYPNSYLVAVENDNRADTTGASNIWSYFYYVPDDENLLVLNYSGSQPLLHFLLTYEQTGGDIPTTPLQSGWKNSDEVIPSSYQFFKTEFSVSDTDTLAIYARLGSMNFYGEDLVGEKPENHNITANGLTHVTELVKRISENIKNSNDPARPYWIFDYQLKVRDGDYNWITGYLYDAISGVQITNSPITAYDVYDLFKNYEEGNEVFALGSDDVGQNGKGDNWGGLVYNTHTQRLGFYAARGTFVQQLPLDFLGNLPLQIDFSRFINGSWLNSDVIVAKMDSLFIEQTDQNTNYIERSLFLTFENRIFPKDTSLFWMGSYQNKHLTKPIKRSERVMQNLASFEKKVKEVYRITEFQPNVQKRSDNNDDEWKIKVNARTGEPVFETPITAFEKLVNIDSYVKANWSNDAHLYHIGSLLPLDNKGKSIAWYYDFFKSGTNQTYRVYQSSDQNEGFSVNIPESFPVNNLALPNFIINSDSLPKMDIDSPYHINEPYLSLSAQLIDGQVEPIWQVTEKYNPDNYNYHYGDSASYYSWAVDDEIMTLFVNANSGRIYNSQEIGFTEQEGLRSAYLFNRNPNLHLKIISSNNLDQGGNSRLWFYVFKDSETNKYSVANMAGSLFIPNVNYYIENPEENSLNFDDMVSWSVGYEEAKQTLLGKLSENFLETHFDEVYAILFTGIPYQDFPDAPFMQSNTPYWAFQFRGTGVDTFFTINASTGNFVSVKEETNKPTTLSLNQNYPNPFNPTTVISYHLSGATQVKLVVFDLLGREIKTLVNERKDKGSYQVNFDASNLPSGVYFYRLTTENFSQAKKMMLIK